MNQSCFGVRTRRALLATATGALLMFSAAAQAASYPTRPVHIIVPFAPGGGSDTVTRIVANQLSKKLGQAFVIDNRGGAGGNIGMEQGAHAAPDGYTLTVITQNMTVNPHLYKNLKFDPMTSFQAVAMINRFYQVVTVNPSVPAHNMAELIALAKAKPNTLTAGNGGIGGTAQMDIDLLCAMTGIQLVQVPYRGEAPVTVDLLSGQLNMTISSFVGVDQFVKAGKLRALAVTSSKPAEQFPDLPTVADTVPGYEMDGWYGIAAPAGTPEAIVKQLEEAIVAVVKDPEISKTLRERGFDPVAMGADDFGKVIKSDYAKYGKLISERGIKIE